MNLHSTSESNLLTERMVSDCGMIEIGIEIVPYGYAVCCGFVGDSEFKIRWHCGDSHRQVISHQTAIYLLLRRRSESVDCLEGIPITDFNPCWEDPGFEKRLTQVMMMTEPRLTEAGK